MNLQIKIIKELYKVSRFNDINTRNKTIEEIVNEKFKATLKQKVEMSDRLKECCCNDTEILNLRSHKLLLESLDREISILKQSNTFEKIFRASKIIEKIVDGYYKALKNNPRPTYSFCTDHPLHTRHW